MTDEQQRPDGWGSVPHVDTIRGDRTPVPQQQAPAPQQQQPPYAAPGPYAVYHPAPRARRRPSRRTLVSVIAGGSALVLLLVAGGVGYAVGSSAHSPTHQVDAFLGDLEDGDVSAALADAGVERTKHDVLLTDAAYAKATDRVTEHRVVGVETSGDQATVHVALRQGSRTVSAAFQLSRTGTDLGVFPVWSLDPVSLGAVDVVVEGPGSTPVRVAGQAAATNRSGTVTLKAFPGTYSVALDGGGWYSAKRQSARVAGFGGTATSPVALSAALTTKGRQAAEAAVNRWVDTCIAMPSIRPDGCSFYAYSDVPGEVYSNERWTLDARPAFGLESWSGRGWIVRTSTPGSATFRADFTGPEGAGTGTAGPIDVSADGYITGFTSAGATFLPAVAESGSGDAGS